MQCIHCRNEVRASESTCRHCGARVIRPSVESTGGRSFARAIRVAAALFVVGLAAAIIFANRTAMPEVIDEMPAPSIPARPEATPAAPAESTRDVLPPSTMTPPAAPPAKERPPMPSPSTTAPETGTRRPAKNAPAVADGRASGTAAAPTPPSSRRPVRVGGNIPTPTKITDVRPVYPATAVQARIQGVVIIEATIAADGRVDGTKVLRSVPLLDEAALEAVRQWVYTPTLLNGVPVPVIMTVTVQFTLQER